MSCKKRYPIRNWSEYNKALVNRGSLTIWFDQNSIKNWNSQKRSARRGRPTVYSDVAIQCCLTIKMVFHLPLRATQGLVSSLLELMRLPLVAPDYTLLCLRQKKLPLTMIKTCRADKNIHLVIDSTGLKLYGEGEWKVKKHGKDKRRTWLKLHLGINADTHDVEACVLTADQVNDCEVVPALLDQVTASLDQVTGDSAYGDCRNPDLRGMPKRG